MHITVVGLGYVGLVTATCLARLGQRVSGLESDVDKVASLERGEAPYYEPHLQGELTALQGNGGLRFTSDPADALREPDVVLVCVGTPSSATGEADLTAVESVIESLARHLGSRTVVALRSTVPVGTTRRVEAMLNGLLRERGGPQGVAVVANPEFLRTGRALDDFLHPSRVVLGRTETATDADVDTLETLYRPLGAPIFVLDAESAELVKNASNTYLAARISFVNELAALCEATGAAIDSVLDAVAADPRIGSDYFKPGIGYGGSCLPKDVRSMIAMGKARGVEMTLARAVDAVNATQPIRVAHRLDRAIPDGLQGARVGLLGLAFKAGTDDIRDSPALLLAEVLRERGATVVACDPQAASIVASREPWIEIADNPIRTATGADAVVLATDWAEYVTADLGPIADVMRGRVLLDARDALDADRVEAAGLTMLSIGRRDGQRRVEAIRSD
ncbi:MAG: UDP-glucose/GDP-mannose dehydrogenase family protein [Chloroflexota bacterium]